MSGSYTFGESITRMRFFRGYDFTAAEEASLDPFGLAFYYADMKVLINGYGRMGREVEKVVVARGHSVAATVDPVDPDAAHKQLDARILQSADVAIEFSAASAVATNAKHYADSGVPAVIGTTGWDADLAAVRDLFRDSGACICGANFSIGAHVFFRLAETSARIINRLPQYDIMMYEIHHRHKKDSPSGTALTAGRRIIAGSDRKKRIVTERLDRAIEDEELHIASVRGGSVPGVHRVLIDSDVDTIEISHTARSRGGFALGAVMAAEWVLSKRGFYTVEQFVEELLATGGVS